MSASSDRVAFIAGASGAIGAVLCRLLVADGWRVVGATRSPERAAMLAAIGVQPVLVDVYDRDALVAAAIAAAPRVVVHQLTDLPKVYSAEAMAAARAGNARIREVGTANLVLAARRAGAARIVAQSIAFAYAAGGEPHDESAPLDAAAWPSVIRLEELVTGAGLEAVVLRYGRLYGPNTWAAVAPAGAPLHVDAAADAARRAMTSPCTGTYNIAEDDGVVSTARARRELGWSAAFRAA